MAKVFHRRRHDRRLMTRKPTRSRLSVRPPELTGGDAAPRTRVFISYRREDAGVAAEHLYASLSQRLGADSIFRDLATIQPGQDFPAMIDEAIRGTSVFIALIGLHWHYAGDGDVPGAPGSSHFARSHG